ncbi:elongation factor G [Brucepastera parasyntrophica]|uniref:elongation factor G n=1 Tax=Brucepastera parasyntrophica TaxID=2880008 RepID=UPI00210BAE43|nr:elongation factor G [Brucepastera parasyntrophica]ULQ59429.1 elongation factor G [Brucepastera parasyntrophica]
MGFSTDMVRTIAIAGHGQTGKTTLIERLLLAAGVIQRAEAVETGKTVSDFTPEEIERKISIYSSLAHLPWRNKLFNFWDTPGSSDFIGEVICAFRASELAIMLLDARAGVQIETIKLWRNLDRRNKARLLFINHMDDERADFEAAVQDVHVQFKVEVCAVTIPMGSGKNYKGIIDVLHHKAYIPDGNTEKEIPVPPEFEEEYTRTREILAGAAAEGDEDLLVKFIDEAGLSDEDIVRGLQLAIKDNRIVPAFAGSGIDGTGITSLLNFIDEIVPSPEGCLEVSVKPDGTEETVKIDPSQPLSCFVVKTSNDQFSGKLSYIKVITGTLSADSEVFNISEDRKEKIGKLYRTVGKKLIETKELCAGDIGLAVKLASAKTNNTLAANQSTLPFIKLRTPAPVYSMAVSAKDKKDDDKISELLLRACEEDQTLSFVYNAETKQNVLSGMGDLHISIILNRIKLQTKIEVQTSIPRIAYRETIQRKAQSEYTHKKQSGGHGQYARVVLSIAPLERGEAYSFTNAVFGGAISKGYIPGVEKGVKEAMENGVLAGYPVVDVGATVLDGKEHPVDSSEMAFKIAARNAFKDAMRNAGPILLEPIMSLTVFVDTNYLGDIMSDLSGRRGHILGQSNLGNGIEEIRAQVPHQELLKYAIDLRSMTSGTGSFEMVFDHYSPISGKIADDVIAAAKEFIKQQNEDD